MQHIVPAYLNEGDEVRIVSPSGMIHPGYIEGARATLTAWELNVTESINVRNCYGRFSGTKEQRLTDLQEALDSPQVKAILCSRGGYGLAQIVDKLDLSTLRKYPKWIIGFSDITILHNAATTVGVCSVHGIMAKHLTELSLDSKPVADLRELLFGNRPTYTWSSSSFNRPGAAKGILTGGNLSVLSGLRSTQFDLLAKGSVLFIEDIAEKPYHIDRMMQNLRISGVLKNLSGLIVGQFTDCPYDEQMMQSIPEIIYEAVTEYDYPVCFDFPAGHVDYNLPLIMGGNVQLHVAPDKTELKFS